MVDKAIQKKLRYVKARCHYQSFLCQENFDKGFDETLIVTTVKEIFDQKR
jgi:hypothetical protein